MSTAPDLIRLRAELKTRYAAAILPASLPAPACEGAAGLGRTGVLDLLVLDGAGLRRPVGPRNPSLRKRPGRRPTRRGDP